MSRATPDVGEVFAALADRTRREVVARVGRGPQRASELAAALGATRPAMSRHLRVLRAAGLITETDDASDGRARLLELAPGAFDGVRAFIDEVESYWGAQLASFQVLAEARAATRPARRRAS